MIIQKNKYSKRSAGGFTIVELLIVVVIIAILAAIVIVSYNGIAQQARTTNTKADLTSQAKKLELDKVTNGAFTGAAINNYLLVDSTNTTVTYKYGDQNGFCMEGVSKSNSSLRFYVQTTNGITNTQTGTCPVLANTEVETRCIVGYVYVVTDQTNYSGGTITSQIQSPYGNSTTSVAAGAHHTIPHDSNLTSIGRGLVTITMSSSTFSATRFFAYEPRTC